MAVSSHSELGQSEFSQVELNQPAPNDASTEGPRNAAGEKAVGLNRFVVWGLFAAIGIGAAFLRLYRLSLLPPGLNFDEGAHGIDALTILGGHFMPFSWEGGGRESLFAYLVAASVHFLGREALAIRLPAALASLFSVAAIFGAGSALFKDDGGHTRLFGRIGLGRHQFIGLLAAALMAFSLNQTILGRTGWRANTFLILEVTAVWLLWAGIKRNHLGLLMGAGVATGLLPYTYIPARLFPILLLFGAGSGLLLGQITPVDRLRLRRGVVIYLVVAALVAAPILIFFALNPDAFFYRSKYLWIADTAVNQGAFGETIWLSTVAHIKAFGVAGDSRLIHNYASLPLLAWPEAIFFWIGLIYSGVQWRRPAYRFLLFWFLLMLVPGVVAYDNNPPNFLRMMGAIPAAYLLSALGAWHTLAAAHSLVQRRFAALRPVWETGVGLLLILLLIGQGARVYTLYFQRWAQEDRLFSTYHGYMVDLVQDLAQIPAPNNLVYVTPVSNFNQSGRLYNFEFLYQGDIPVHRFRTADDDFPEQLRRAITQDTAQDAARLADPEIRAVTWYDTDAADPNSAMNFVLSKYATPQARWSQETYGVDAYTQPLLDRPWTFYQELLPVDVPFDVGIELTGMAVGRHGGEQFSEKRVAFTSDQGPLWLALAWRANQPIQPTLRLSLRLYTVPGDGSGDISGERVHLEEYELLDIVERPTNEWTVGRETMIYTIFGLPPDLAEGRYQLRLLVYDLDSLAPAVQVGIWEPELPLIDIDFRRE